jgi:hypothetical protein
MDTTVETEVLLGSGTLLAEPRKLHTAAVGTVWLLPNEASNGQAALYQFQ